MAPEQAIVGRELIQDLFWGSAQPLQTLKEPLKSRRIVAELRRFNDLTFFGGQSTHQTRLHTNINAHHICQGTWYGLLRGSFRYHLARCSHASLFPTGSTGNPSDRDERELNVDRQSPRFATRYCNKPHRCLRSRRKGSRLLKAVTADSCRPHVTYKGSPVASISIADPSLFRLGSPTYQLVYELLISSVSRITGFDNNEGSNGSVSFNFFCLTNVQ